MREGAFLTAKREEAATICAIAASGGMTIDGRRFFGYRTIQLEIGSHDDACGLALEAWLHVYQSDQEHSLREVDAEAEALIRCGWTP